MVMIRNDPCMVILDGDYKEEEKTSKQSWEEMSNLSHMKVPALIRIIALCWRFYVGYGWVGGLLDGPWFLWPIW